MKIDRRYGTTPAQRGSASGANCPDVLRLDTGEYLVIGRLALADITPDQLTEHDASIGEDEVCIIVPADMLESAAQDIVKRGPVA